METIRRVLITGGAGFIGSHLADRLLLEGWDVTVVDNFDPFYDAAYKQANIAAHVGESRYRLVRADIRNLAFLRSQLTGRYDVIVHLAARAGVRPSIADPVGYQEVNVLGTQNMLELAKTWGVDQFVFASSSSVYGVNPQVPWSEEDHVLLPISPYAGTKISGELLGHVYSHLYDIRFLALRFFTVYGPRQRPDLAIHKMARMMLNGEAIPVFGNGQSCRDYTYIDDILNGIRGAMDYKASKYEVINLGNNRTIALLDMVHTIERATGTKARIEFRPDQPGDVPQTFASTAKASALLGYQPQMGFEEGVTRFVQWLELQTHSAARAQYA